MAEPLDAELTAFANALGGLVPAAQPLDRDRLLYEAGRASVRPRLAPWLTAAACLMVAAGSWLRPEPQRVTEVRVVVRPPADADEPPTTLRLVERPTADGAGGYLKLRNQVVIWGADALPSAPGANDTPAPAEIRWKSMTSPGDI